MDKQNMNKKPYILSLAILFPSFAFASNIYEASKSYQAGEKISFNGAIYEAQWWANPNQSPEHITENSWESPWVLISKTGGEIAPTVNQNERKT